MYSPKIKDELIPKIYRMAKAKGMSMTALVNEILKKALKRMEAKRDECSNENGLEIVKETVARHATLPILKNIKLI